MEIELLVDTLYHKTNNNNNNDDGSPSQLMGIAIELFHALSAAQTEEHKENYWIQQLERMLIKMENNNNNHTNLINESFVVTSFVVLYALLSFNNNNNNNNYNNENVLRLAKKWESEMLPILSNNNNNNNSVFYQSCVYYVCAMFVLHIAPQIYLQNENNNNNKNNLGLFLNRVCATFDTAVKSEDTLPADVGVELLMQVTSLLYTYFSKHNNNQNRIVWRSGEEGLMLNTELEKHKSDDKHNKHKNKNTKNKERKKDSKPQNNNNNLAEALLHPLTVENGNQHNNNHHNENEKKKDIFSTMPNKAFVLHFRGTIIHVCVQALRDHHQHYTITVTALLCRRVLIPLLILNLENNQNNNNNSLEVYEPLLLSLVESLTDDEDAAVILLATLFDFIFRNSKNNNHNENDYRRSPFLWNVMVKSLFNSVYPNSYGHIFHNNSNNGNNNNNDVSVRAAQQLRVLYLLKRIIFLCEEGDLQNNNNNNKNENEICYHPYFTWYPQNNNNNNNTISSSAVWNDYFLIFETLTEYGWHLLSPTMKKLDALLQLVQEELQNKNNNGKLHPIFLEVLFLKFVLHPNTGIRRLALRKVFHLPILILKQFSKFFLGKVLLEAACDPRLCSELDRNYYAFNNNENIQQHNALPSTFMEVIVKENNQNNNNEEDYVQVRPMVAEIETFYEKLFLHVWNDTKERTARRDAFLLLLQTIQLSDSNTNPNNENNNNNSATKPSRFAVTLVSCVIHKVALALLAESIYKRENKILSVSIFDADNNNNHHNSVIGVFSSIFRDTLLENIPHWLNVRLNLLLFSSLAYFAVMEPTLFHHKNSFWKLFSLSAVTGSSTTAADAVGAIAPYGSVVYANHIFLIDVMKKMEKEVTTILSKQNDNHHHHHTTIMGTLLGVDTLLDRVKQHITKKSELSPVAIKELFFLLGTLIDQNNNNNNNNDNNTIVKDIVSLLIQSILSFSEENSELNFLAVLTSFVECYHSCTNRRFCYVLCQLWENKEELLNVLENMFEIVFSIMYSAFHNNNNNHLYLLEVQNCEIGSAFLFIVEIIYQTILEINNNHNIQKVCQSLKIGEKVKQLLDVISRETSSELLFCASASTLLNSILCGVRPNREAYQNHNKNDFDFFALPIGAETPFNTSSNEKEDNEPYRLDLTGEECIEVSTALMKVLQTNKKCSNNNNYNNNNNNNNNNSAILISMDSCLYNSIYVLSYALRHNDNNNENVIREYMKALKQFSLDQTETCWGVNTPFVFDLLNLVLLFPCPDDDNNNNNSNEDVIHALMSHRNDVGARLQNRTVCLAFCGLNLYLQNCNTNKEDMKERVKTVVRTLQSCFSEREDESDRNYYFVAVSAALLALQNPLGEANNNNDKNKTFPHVRALLLQCALFFNSGRDEEENESTLTATEGILHPDSQSHFFPIEFSHCYPPTVRLSSTARALVLSTILYCCRQDDQLLLSLSKELLEMNDTPYTVYEEDESVLFSSNVIVKEPCMPNSHTHRGRLRLWQLLCALQPMLFVEKENMQMHETELSQLFTTLLDRCMTINNSGSVRHFMELYGIRFLKEMPQFYVLLSERLKNYNLRPQVCGSYVLIAAHAILQYEERQVEELTNNNNNNNENENVFEELFPRLLQQSSSNQHLLRIIADIGLYKVAEARQRRRTLLQNSKKANNNGDTAELSRDAACLIDYISSAPEHVKFREKHEDMLFFSLEEATAPRALFCTKIKEANTLLQESLPCATFDRIANMEGELQSLTGATYRLERSRVHCWATSLQLSALLRPLLSFPYIPHTNPTERLHYYPDYTPEAIDHMRAEVLPEGGVIQHCIAAQETENDDNNSLDVIQKKVTSWWNSEVYNELNPRALQVKDGGGNTRKKTSLIVVGSLLENPVNLAGLCRCGDIFAVERITVPDKSMFQHPHFIAAARSAELWVDWEEVSPAQLESYLIKLRKEEGYTIVGIEQTSGSVSMEQFDFPEKTAVVLGAEGKGVPATILPLFDVCVEIPQYGLIRSLNVHVTGALVMFEYARQFLM